MRKAWSEHEHTVEAFARSNNELTKYPAGGYLSFDLRNSL